MLIEKYEALSKRLEETQVLLDTVKTEIESSNGGKKIVSMREIIAEMQEFRDKYERLAAVYEKYPDDASISALEEKAQRAEKLEREIPLWNKKEIVIVKKPSLQGTPAKSLKLYVKKLKLQML